MKYFTNSYYSSDNNHFVSVRGEIATPERMKMIKINNTFIFSIFSNMIFKDDFLNTPAMKRYMPTILAGNLARSEKVTGYDSKKLGEKIKFLVLYVSDKNHPENMEKFKNSFFVKSIMAPLYHGGFTGGYRDTEERWELYKNIGSDPTFNNMNALNAATKCYQEDTSLPVGLDMASLIDGLVQTDANGNFKIVTDFEDLKVKENMIEAMKEFINLLKSSKRFKENFNNPNVLDAEFEDA